MGSIIYIYGAERLGVKSKTQKQKKAPLNQPRFRRQHEIDRLVKERRQLRKLKKAEHRKRQRKKKEWTRTLFYSNPYNFVKSLFDREKSGNLKLPIKDPEDYLRKTR